VVDFLDYSRIEAGQLELHLEHASLRSIAEDAAASLRAISDRRSIDLVIEAKEDIEARVDRQRIYQVITNLVSNAVRFSPDSGTVTVRIDAENGSARLCVEDQGPGIDQKYREAVFDKFFQAPDPGYKKLHEGTSGIGLAICRGLVEAHHGKIWTQSEPGRGSRFYVAIPLK
jgi:signal transduction histidine kinase